MRFERIKIYPNNRSGGVEGISVLRCSNCGLVRLSETVDDPDKFYAEGNMYDGGTPPIEVLRRESFEDDRRRYLFMRPMIVNKSVLDFGCGDGGFLKFAKESDIADGVELNEVNRKALNDEGLNIYKSIDEAGSYDVITLFHVLEHLPNPVEMLQLFAGHLKKNGQIIIEVPNADDALLSLYGSEAFADFTYWICHIYLYNTQTLKMLVAKAGLKINFVKQIQRYPLANHLYWLSKNLPGGHAKWAFMADDKELNERYAACLSNLGMADTILMSVSV